MKQSSDSSQKFDWKYFLSHIAIIAIPVALQNLLSTTGSMSLPSRLNICAGI